ncbi:RDD family protein [Planococcus salinus]|uniref:RDD family protein n=1 Tax=Planococcus salinus TaxID=1848460 RepID=A0A3M8PCE4_9BACL|nr:RDD family protein [Planococcus salinus]RNF41262.1 RDD family protein [Planococcus salinus]
MNQLTKKRAKAILIDTLLATGVSVVIESALRRKMDNEFFYVVVLPTLTLWGLEYAQIKTTGQTAGQKLMGIKVVSENSGELNGEQILKRAAHRDFISTFTYLRHRQEYDVYNGSKFPHDVYAETAVIEK